MKQIAFLTPYPLNIAPSQRFRFEQYFSILTNHNFGYTIFPFISQEHYRILYSNGRQLQKLVALIKGFIKRLFLLPQLIRYDFVFIHREAAPIGPPVFEWIIAKIIRRKIIYDFDDAIWLTDKINESIIEKWIRNRKKVESICAWSYKVSCGNGYLQHFALQFNKQSFINPTTIDTECLHNPALFTRTNDSKSHIIIGWTGSHSTLKYLKLAEDALLNIESTYPFVQFLIIANQTIDLKLSNVKFITWSKDTEAEDLLKIDIGIMPLPDDEWSKGKCGFKALQYMAMEIPCVVSPVGVNTTIVEHGTTGFLATTQNEWYTYLQQLIENELLRKQIGKAGREKVKHYFSVSANEENFLKLFA